jgi:hypothetical protein
MSQSLRDQLLGLGYAAPKPEPRPVRTERDNAPSRGGADGRAPRRGDDKDARPSSRPAGRPDPRRPTGKPDPRAQQRPPQDRPRNPAGARPARSPGAGARPDIDLGKAFALRAQREKEERIAAESERQAAAARKREAKARIVELVAGKSLNDAQAEIARHFEYGGKIRRVHVTAEQLRAVNAGDLGVVQLDGRYLLFDAPTVAQVRELLPSVIALMVVAGAEEDDPFADPRYQVPDDLVW